MAPGHNSHAPCWLVSTTGLIVSASSKQSKIVALHFQRQAFRKGPAGKACRKAAERKSEVISIRENTYRSFGAQSRWYFNRPGDAIPKQPIDTAAAWQGRQISTDALYYQLSPQEVDEIKAAVAAAPAELSLIHAQNFPLPTLAHRIKSWQTELQSGCGVQVIRGFPLDMPPALVERAYWGIGHHLGTPGAQNPDQELLGHVRNYHEADDFVRLYRTTQSIDLHCDAADIVGLLCLQPAARGGGCSRIVSSVTLFNLLLLERPDLVPRLFQPFRLDGRGERRPGQKPFSLVTPCCFDGDNLRTFYHSEYFRSVERHGVTLTQEERDVLDFYDTRGMDPDICLDMELHPGDIQFISNHTIVHARTAYEDDPQHPRHLLRLWLSLA